jgi:16S rRNA (adenine1518-N6/adenine1519-N6)-dimethyltransferase
VLAGWRADARILFDVPPSAFTPPPKVVSSVVELVPRTKLDPCDPRLLSAAAQAAFGQRRKMLRQSLKGFAVSRGMDIAQLLAAADVDPTSRAEEVEIAGFVRLARAAAHGQPPLKREPALAGRGGRA